MAEAHEDWGSVADRIEEENGIDLLDIAARAEKRYHAEVKEAREAYRREHPDDMFDWKYRFFQQLVFEEMDKALDRKKGEE